MADSGEGSPQLPKLVIELCGVLILKVVSHSKTQTLLTWVHACPDCTELKTGVYPEHQSRLSSQKLGNVQLATSQNPA